MAENVWTQKPDDTVRTALSQLDDYTEEGQQQILAEATRRAMMGKP